MSKKLICFIDDLFEKTLTLASGLYLYNKNCRENPDEVYILLIQLCGSDTKDSMAVIEEKRNKRIDELRIFDEGSVKCRCISVVEENKEEDGNTSNSIYNMIIDEANDFAQIHDVAPTKILFMLDLKLKMYDPELLKRKRIVLSLFLAHRMNGQYKLELYSEYDDERIGLKNLWRKSYYSNYSVQYDKDIISRTKFDPEYFDIDEGEKVFHELDED